MRITLLSILLLLMLPVSAGIYKSVDENGNVVFSDQPSAGAEEIEKKEIMTVPSTVPDIDFSRGEDEKSEQEPYENIAITSPANDSAIRDNAGNISVNIATKPALGNGHQIVIYLDGTEVARDPVTAFDFQNVDRGTHTLAAAVANNEGKELKRSAEISFSLLRHSVQNQNQNPGAGAPVSPTNPPRPPGTGGPSPTNPPRGTP